MGDDQETRLTGLTHTPLSSLTPDPRNARRHDARNLALIEAALREVGAARSVVVDEDGTILAGNATVHAAEQVGLQRVRIVEADGSELVAVRRSGLTQEQKRRLALLDNRSAELAEWDTEVLASLAEEVDLADLWEPDELAELLGEEQVAAPFLGDPDAVPDPPTDHAAG
jgi:ParB-like chromosome segregation protein Spo0J